MSNDGKKPVWVKTEAHDYLKDFCDRTGRTQVDVVSELLNRFLKPDVDKARAEGKL